MKTSLKKCERREVKDEIKRKGRGEEEPCKKGVGNVWGRACIKRSKLSG